MAEDPKDWDIATRLVRGGLARSSHGEIAEALYLTQSFAYESAEAADARFSGEKPGYIYARYANPTVAMFEQRLALLEGAEACRALASGMAAVHLALMGLVKAGDHVVAGTSLLREQPKPLDRELLGRFGQYRLVSGTGASERSATDAALISGSLVDPECFSLIVERHHTPVFRYLTSRVGRASSEDLLADVFETAFRARQRYDTRYHDALPWLLGIATNVIHRHLRSETRRSSMVRRVTQLHGRNQEPSESVDSVVTSAERNDELHQVRNALETLDDKHREVLVLFAGLGFSYEDIARALGIRVGTVRSRLSRARRNLRELLATDGQYGTYVEADEPNQVAQEHPR